MTGSAVKYWLLLLVVLGTMYGSYAIWRREQSHGGAGPPVPLTPPATSTPLTDFTLVDQDGNAFDSRSLRGKVWVGSFFFTNCPSVCWKLNQALAAMQETNPGSQAHFISITCDPDDDTPAVLKKYAQHFKADPARWTFLTGDMKLIRRIGNEMFQVAVENETHSDRAFVVDRAGRVRARFRLTEPDQYEKLKQLLAVVEAEPTPADEPPPAAAGSDPPTTPNAPPEPHGVAAEPSPAR
jgi:protein SCO1/2